MATTITNTDLVEATKEAIIVENFDKTLININRVSSQRCFNDTVKVPIISAEAGEFAKGTLDYINGNGKAGFVPVVLNKHLIVNLALPQEDLGKFDYQSILKASFAAMRAKINALVMAEFKAASFTDSEVVGVAADFAYTDYVKTSGFADDYTFGPDRSVILAPAYVNSLMGDATVASALSREGKLMNGSFGISLLDVQIRKGEVPSTGNVVGAIFAKNSVAMAFGRPSNLEKATYTEAVDPVTGITAFVREVEDAQTGGISYVLEVICGVAKGTDEAVLLKSA